MTDAIHLERPARKRCSRGQVPRCPDRPPRKGRCDAELSLWQGESVIRNRRRTRRKHGGSEVRIPASYNQRLDTPIVDIEVKPGKNAFEFEVR